MNSEEIIEMELTKLRQIVAGKLTSIEQTVFENVLKDLIQRVDEEYQELRDELDELDRQLLD